MAEKRYDIALFDLDGTLTESEEGIVKSVRFALSKMNWPEPEAHIYRKFIGPPLIDSFLGYCGMQRETAKRACELYKERYNKTGCFENRVYPGILELLRSLRAAGVKTAVCTAKQEPFAEKIAEHFGLLPLFDAVVGSRLDGGRSLKEELIPAAVKALGGTLSKSTVMIGDTWFDADGAQKCGVDFIGVLYGYGEREEMEQKGARQFAADAGELCKLLVK